MSKRRYSLRELMVAAGIVALGAAFVSKVGVTVAFLVWCETAILAALAWGVFWFFSDTRRRIRFALLLFGVTVGATTFGLMAATAFPLESGHPSISPPTFGIEGFVVSTVFGAFMGLTVSAMLSWFSNRVAERPARQEVPFQDKSLQPRLKRRTRISLRGLLVVLTVLFVLLGFKVREVGRQKAAVEWAEARGGNVIYDYQNRFTWFTYESGDVSIRANPSDKYTVDWVPKWLDDWLGVDFFHKPVAISWPGTASAEDTIELQRLFSRCEIHESHPDDILPQ